MLPPKRVHEGSNGWGCNHVLGKRRGTVGAEGGL